MPPAPRIRPYKDFLTPALHRRFALATATLFGLCYVEAVLIGDWNSRKLPASPHNVSPNMSDSYLVMGSVWQSWYKNRSPFYPRLYDIHSSSRPTTRRNPYIIFSIPNLHEIRRSI